MFFGYRLIEIFAFLAITSSLVSLVSSHSQLICAKYDTKTGNCIGAYPRNANYTFVQESYPFQGGAICQFPWANPINSYYANGANCPDWAPCPAPMGTYSPGEQFTIMWYARNHAVENQTPGNIYLYMSPIETVNQGQDVSSTVMKQNLICSGPFMSCNGQNGNTVPCTLTCNMPNNVQPGYYTFWWYWPWSNTGVNYATCADIQVTGSSGSSSSSSSTSSSSSSSSGSNQSPVTTKSIPKATTGKKASTSTSSSTSSSSTSSTSSTSSSSTSCTDRDMKCMTSETYQTCAHGKWGPSQSCSTGTTCHPTNNVIYCY